MLGCFNRFKKSAEIEAFVKMFAKKRLVQFQTIRFGNNPIKRLWPANSAWVPYKETWSQASSKEYFFTVFSVRPSSRWHTELQDDILHVQYVGHVWNSWGQPIFETAVETPTMFSSSMLSALNLLSILLESARLHERPYTLALFIAAAAAVTLIKTAKLSHAHSFCTCQTSYKIHEGSGQLSVSEM